MYQQLSELQSELTWEKMLTMLWKHESKSMPKKRTENVEDAGRYVTAFE